MTRHWRRALVGASVLSLGFGGAAFAGGDKEKRDEVQWEQQEQGLGGSGQQGQPATQQTQRPGQQTQQAQPGQQAEQAQLKGEVVQVKRDTVFLRLEEGAVLPFKVSQQTQLQGAEERATGGSGQAGQQQPAATQEKELKGKKLTQHLQPGDKLNVTLAAAQSKENVAETIQLDQQSAQQKEIQGTIASKSGNWVNLQYEGALVPLKLDRQTSYEGVQNQQALREGAQVRANFRVEDGTNNVATRIQVENQQGKGGAAQEGQPEPLPQSDEESFQGEQPEELQQPQPEPQTY